MTKKFGMLTTVISTPLPETAKERHGLDVQTGKGAGFLILISIDVFPPSPHPNISETKPLSSKAAESIQARQ